MLKQKDDSSNRMTDCDDAFLFSGFVSQSRKHHSRYSSSSSLSSAAHSHSSGSLKRSGRSTSFQVPPTALSWPLTSIVPTLSQDERDLAVRLGIDESDQSLVRLQSNMFYLSSGANDLLDILNEESFDLNALEEAAIPIILHLRSLNRTEEANEVFRHVFPFFDQRRFFPFRRSLQSPASTSSSHLSLLLSSNGSLASLSSGSSASSTPSLTSPPPVSSTPGLADSMQVSFSPSPEQLHFSDQIEHWERLYERLVYLFLISADEDGIPCAKIDSEWRAVGAKLLRQLPETCMQRSSSLQIQQQRIPSPLSSSVGDDNDTDNDDQVIMVRGETLKDEEGEEEDKPDKPAVAERVKSVPLKAPAWLVRSVSCASDDFSDSDSSVSDAYVSDGSSDKALYSITPPIRSNPEAKLHDQTGLSRNMRKRIREYAIPLRVIVVDGEQLSPAAINRLQQSLQHFVSKYSNGSSRTKKQVPSSPVQAEPSHKDFCWSLYWRFAEDVSTQYEDSFQRTLMKKMLIMLLQAKPRIPWNLIGEQMTKLPWCKVMHRNSAIDLHECALGWVQAYISEYPGLLIPDKLIALCQNRFLDGSDKPLIEGLFLDRGLREPDDCYSSSVIDAAKNTVSALSKTLYARYYGIPCEKIMALTRTQDLLLLLSDRVETHVTELVRVMTSSNIGTFLVLGLKETLVNNQALLHRIISLCIRRVNAMLGELVKNRAKRDNLRLSLLSLGLAWRNMVLYLSLLPASVCVQQVNTLHRKFQWAESKFIRIDQAVKWLEAVSRYLVDEQPCSAPPPGWERCSVPLYGASCSHWLLAPGFYNHT